MLFVKYISDKYAGVPFAPITIPPGASFKDLVALQGASDIGDQITKKIMTAGKAWLMVVGPRMVGHSSG